MSCGKPTTKYVVEGASLKCGTRLYWKVVGERNVSELEIVLCDECKKGGSDEPTNHTTD